MSEALPISQKPDEIFRFCVGSLAQDNFTLTEGIFLVSTQHLCFVTGQVKLCFLKA